MPSRYRLSLVPTLLLASLAAGFAAAAADGPPKREKRIYAHYMGCYPVAAAATAYHRTADTHLVRHDGQRQHDAYGDRWRNWPLVPDGMKVSLEESADLEIRRALRGGIDGFAIDAWAGGDGAKAVCDALFQVAEQKSTGAWAPSSTKCPTASGRRTTSCGRPASWGNGLARSASSSAAEPRTTDCWPSTVSPASTNRSASRRTN